MSPARSPAFGGRRALAHVGELDSIRNVAKIGNAAEVRPIAGAAGRSGALSSAVGGGRRLHAHELRPVRRFLQPRGDFGDQLEQGHRAGTVDLVPGIARLVIIGVQPGKEEEHRHLLGGERSVIARAVAGGVGKIDVQLVLWEPPDRASPAKWCPSPRRRCRLCLRGRGRSYPY